MTLANPTAGSGPRVLMIPDLGRTNPYLRLLTSALRGRGVRVDLVRRSGRRPLTRAAAGHGRPDVVHLQWHHRFFVPHSGGLAPAMVAGGAFLWDCLALRRTGARFVWTVHNIANHERRLERWERTACRMLARLVDRLHVHCEAAVPIVAKSYGVPPGRITVIPHGHYIDAYPPPPDRAAARSALGLPPGARVFLFFGQVRDYKGLEELLERFSGLDAPDARLCVVGRPRSPSLGRTLQRAASNDARIGLHLEFVESGTLVRYIAAADAVVLPYRDSLTSGSAILAASCGRPAILPAVGCLAELPREAALLYDADRADGLKEALEAALHAPLDRMGAEARRHIARFTWEDAADRFADLYAELAPRAAPVPAGSAAPVA